MPVFYPIMIFIGNKYTTTITRTMEPNLTCISRTNMPHITFQWNRGRPPYHYSALVVPSISGSRLPTLWHWRTLNWVSRPLTGSPMACQLFFLLFPPPNMAFSETKHNEGNLALIWYFRRTFRTRVFFHFHFSFSTELWSFFEYFIAQKCIFRGQTQWRKPSIVLVF